MFKKTLFITCLTLSLAACEYENVRDEGDGTEIETIGAIDNGTEQQQSQNGEGNTDGVTTFALSECEPNCEYPRDALKNPNSLLAKRLVFFPFNSDAIPEQMKDMLIAHAKYLANNTDVVVRIEGHTDERGTREYNLALSEKRAKAVRQFMLLHGAGSNNVEVHAFGEELPMALGSNEQAWQENRRAELVYDNL